MTVFEYIIGQALVTIFGVSICWFDYKLTEWIRNLEL